MINVMTRSRVLAKWSKDVQRDDGTVNTYYSLKLANPQECENDTCNVSKEVYDAVEPQQDVVLYGYVARFGKNTALKFTAVFDKQKHFAWK